LGTQRPTGAQSPAAGWIKMPLGMEVGFGPGDIILDGHAALAYPLPKRATAHPLFGPCLLWPKGCMDQDAILSMEVGLGPGDIVLHWDSD